MNITLEMFKALVQEFWEVQEISSVDEWMGGADLFIDWMTEKIKQAEGEKPT